MQAALIGPSGHTFLGPAGLTIGRMQSNQYVVYDRRVSARHAVISYLKQGYFTITDIGSTNGTFVNGLLLVHNVPEILHSGDTICIGDTVLTFQSSDQFLNQPHANSSLNEHETTWDGPATDRFVRVRYQPDVNYHPAESQEKQASFVPDGTENHKLWQSASVTPSQKVDKIPNTISKETENVTSAKLTFIGLSGQRISGTIILTKETTVHGKLLN